MAGSPVQPLLGVLLGPAADGVPDERDEEQQEQRAAQRVLVEPQDPAAAPHRPRRVGLIAEIARIGVDQLVGAGPARLGRADLIR